MTNVRKGRNAAYRRGRVGRKDAKDKTYGYNEDKYVIEETYANGTVKALDWRALNQSWFINILNLIG
jgi:hypothetical protein